MTSLEVMLLSDVKTWKTVRRVVLNCILELFLKDYENKLVVAKTFADHYTTIYDNVEKDDHDHKYSTASITVQRRVENVFPPASPKRELQIQVAS